MNRYLCIYSIYLMYISRKCVGWRRYRACACRNRFSDRKRAKSHAHSREKKIGLMARGWKGTEIAAQEYRAWCVHTRVHAHDRVVGELDIPLVTLSSVRIFADRTRGRHVESTRDPINRFLEDAPARFILRSLTHTNRRGLRIARIEFFVVKFRRS